MKQVSASQVYTPSALPIRLSLKTDLHLARKAWHLVTGILIAYLYYAVLSKLVSVIILGSILGLDLLVEITRLRVPSLNEKILKYWGILMRSHETSRFSGVPYYLASSCIVIALFPKPIAVLSILLLAFGDPMASLFGNLFGKLSLQFKSGKTLIGTLAGILTCFFVSFIFLNNAMNLPKHVLFQLSLFGGLAGGISELLSFEIDDNFSVPIISGFVLWFCLLVYV